MIMCKYVQTLLGSSLLHVLRSDLHYVCTYPMLKIYQSCPQAYFIFACKSWWSLLGGQCAIGTFYIMHNVIVHCTMSSCVAQSPYAYTKLKMPNEEISNKSVTWLKSIPRTWRQDTFSHHDNYSPPLYVGASLTQLSCTMIRETTHHNTVNIYSWL